MTGPSPTPASGPTFGDLSTPLPDALATTLDWYAAAQAA